MITSVFAGAVSFAGAATGGIDNDQASTSVDTTIDSNNEVPTFAENSSFRTVARGDLLREPYTEFDGHTKRPYTVEFGNESTVTIVIDSRNTDNGDYAGNVTIEDNGSGEAKLYLNTWEMGHSNPFEVEGGEITRWDQVEYDNDSKLLNKTKATEQDAYDLLIREGSDPEATATLFSDYAKLKIVEAETEEMHMVTAPADTEIDEASDVWKEISVFSDTTRNVSNEQDRNVSEGDTMIIAPWGGGYYGPAEHAKDVTESDTDALQWLMDNDYYNFSVTETNVTEENQKVLNVDQALETDAINFVSAGAYYHVVIALDTGAPVFQHGGDGEFVTAEAGDNFNTSFAKEGRVDSEIQEDEDGDPFERYAPTIYESFEVVEPNVSLDSFPDGGAENANISGSTTLSTGTQLAVNVTVGDETYQQTALVTEQTNTNGEHLWNTTVDLSEADSGQEITVEISAPTLGTITFNGGDDGQDCGPPEHADPPGNPGDKCGSS